MFSSAAKKGLNSKQLRQDITYIQKAIKLFYKNNISSVSYKNNASPHEFQLCTSGVHGEVALAEPHLPSRKINPKQSSTTELLLKEGFNSKLIIEINLIASYTCKDQDESLKSPKCRSKGCVMAERKHSCSLSSPPAGLDGWPEGAI